MNICFICKYPPIEGGVSMHGYWTARGLAERGHKVFVVTNANEVEAAHRLHLGEAETAAGGEYARAFPESAGFVKVLSTEPPDRKRLAYIPLNNPTVTRLASIAADTVRAEGCEVIFSYYLEPFGMAAHLASSWTGVPYVFKHAGSDLYRLAPIEDLQTAYVEVMRAANRVVSSGGCSEQVAAYGVPDEQIVSDVPFGLPPEYFNPDAEPLDLAALLAELAAGSESPEDFAPLDPALPVLGLYGKLGEFKGSYDLLHAMSRLAREGFPFQLLAMSGGWQKDYFRWLADDLKVREYVRFLPFRPHWQVPRFIRSCRAVVFLERDFPISAHGPTVPSEIIACGKCLVVSEEAARKQQFRMRIRNFKNVIVVPDPKRQDVLADCIRFALGDGARADEIGRRGFQELSLDPRTHERYVDWLENTLTEVAGEAPLRAASASASAPGRRADESVDESERLFTLTHSLLNDAQRKAFREALGGGPAPAARAGDESEEVVRLGRQLLSFIDREGSMSASLVRDVCRYECELHEWRMSRPSPEKANGDGLVFAPEHLLRLSPSVRGRYKVLDFSHDVEAAIEAIKKGEPPPQDEKPLKVLFHEGSAPLAINGPTERLLSLLAENARTTEEVLDALCDYYLGADASRRAGLRENCMSALEGLYWAGIIEFKSFASSGGDAAVAEQTVC